MIKLRLQRKGRKKRPYYHIVVADSRSPRDGRIIEKIGRYDNVSENKHVIIDESRAMHWLNVGAQPTDKVRNLLKGEGILMKMHLQRWGKTDEEIDAALTEWRQGRDERMAKVISRKDQLAQTLEDEEKAFKDKLVRKAKEAKEAAEAPKEEAPVAEADASADSGADAPAEATAEATAEEAAGADAPEAVETTENDAETDAVAEEASEAPDEAVAEASSASDADAPAEETQAEAPADEAKAASANVEEAAEATAEESQNEASAEADASSDEPKAEDAPAEEESKKDAPDA